MRTCNAFGCNNQLTGNQRVWCSEVCRKRAERRNKNPNLQNDTGIVEKLIPKGSDQPPIKLSDEYLLNELSQRGYAVELQKPEEDRHITIDTSRFHNDTITIGVVSDTHLGSMYQQLTSLKTFYRLCAERGITTMLHCGDMCDGNGKVYGGHIHEIFVHGCDAQRDYICENYPNEEGITTHVIAGNHDYSFYKDGGYNILESVAKERDDIRFEGNIGGFFHIDNLVAYLMHGRGAGAYALSYKPQKIIGNFSSENKPNIFLLGHFHTACHIPGYRNVEGLQLGAFQSQTPLLKAMGVQPTVCGLILELTPDDMGLASVKTEFVVFHIHKERDY